MRFWKLLFLLLMTACYQGDELMTLDRGYVYHHHERLQEKQMQLDMLKQLDLFEENKIFKEQIEEAHHFHNRALDELLELQEDNTLENREEFEQELERFEVVWSSLIDNYLV